MKNTNVWDQQWKQMERFVFKKTSLDAFAKKAYFCLNQWISKDDKKILEAGSGTGRFCIEFAKKYPDSKIVGIDSSPSAVSLAKKGAKLRGIKNVRFIKADIFKLPFPNNYFDVVFNEGVIEHFHNFEDALDEMIRVTKKHGKVIVAVPNWFSLLHTIYKKIIGRKFEYDYEKSFKQHELISSFKNNALYNIELSGFDSAHAINRFSRYFPRPISSLFLYLGCVFDLFIIPLDKITNRYISRRFGILIVAKGIK